MFQKRLTYAQYFTDTILRFFNSSDRNGDSAMNCADMFRDAEWKALDGEAGKNTRSDLYKLGADDKALFEFIVEVIDCMEWNVNQIED